MGRGLYAVAGLVLIPDSTISLVFFGFGSVGSLFKYYAVS